MGKRVPVLQWCRLPKGVGNRIKPDVTKHTGRQLSRAPAWEVVPADPFHSAQQDCAASRMLRVSLITSGPGGTFAPRRNGPYSSK